jgi:hypothetical protein
LQASAEACATALLLSAHCITKNAVLAGQITGKQRKKAGLIVAVKALESRRKALANVRNAC